MERVRGLASRVHVQGADEARAAGREGDMACARHGRCDGRKPHAAARPACRRRSRPTRSTRRWSCASSREGRLPAPAPAVYFPSGAPNVNVDDSADTRFASSTPPANSSGFEGVVEVDHGAVRFDGNVAAARVRHLAGANASRRRWGVSRRGPQDAHDPAIDPPRAGRARHQLSLPWLHLSQMRRAPPTALGGWWRHQPRQLGAALSPPSSRRARGRLRRQSRRARRGDLHPAERQAAAAGARASSSPVHPFRRVASRCQGSAGVGRLGVRRGLGQRRRTWRWCPDESLKTEKGRRLWELWRPFFGFQGACRRVARLTTPGARRPQLRQLSQHRRSRRTGLSPCTQCWCGGSRQKPGLDPRAR